MEIQLWQIILLSLYAGFAIWDAINPNFGFNNPVIAGFIAGVVLGDIKTGLAVGGTLQLMILGVGTYGGASMPDYMSGAIVGTAFAIISGKGLEFAIGLAVPIGLLLVQFDVLARFSNTVLQHKAETYADQRDYKKVELMNLLGVFTWGASRAVPVFLALMFGNDLVQKALDLSPEWLLGGLQVAGGLLPALGIAILLRYLPIKNFYAYIIIGFVGAAYLKVPMLGIALLGLALALITFNKRKEEGTQKVVVATAATEGGIIDEDE